MKILLIGRNGQVGLELERALALAPIGEITSVDHAALDLTDFDAIRRTVRDIRPDTIINAAAYTAVDKAESEPQLAMQVNGEAPGVLAEEAKRQDALLVQYSTDYVFDGAKGVPYAESDAPNPMSSYGRSKLAGERAIQAVGPRHLILRTAWVYSLHGKNFLLTMLHAAQEKRALRVVNDQRGTPTWSRTIADATVRMLGLRAGGQAEGLFHLVASGDTTWHAFAAEIFRLRGLHPDLRTIRSDEYPTAARRPMDARLNNEKFSVTYGTLPLWTDALASCLGQVR